MSSDAWSGARRTRRAARDAGGAGRGGAADAAATTTASAADEAVDAVASAADAVEAVVESTADETMDTVASTVHEVEARRVSARFRLRFPPRASSLVRASSRFGVVCPRVCDGVAAGFRPVFALASRARKPAILTMTLAERAPPRTVRTAARPSYR